MGLVVLAGFLVGHFAHLGNLDTCDWYLPKYPKNEFVVGQYASCGIFHLQGLGSSVGQTLW